MKLDVQPFIEKLRKSCDLSQEKRLLIIQVLGDDASDLYVRSKLKEAEKWNVHCHVAKFENNATTEELGYYLIEERNNGWDGIIVQLPLPKHINEQYILDLIPTKLNVDGFEQTYVKHQLYTPCTALGIIEYLKSIITLEGKTVTLIGRGKTVGKPLIPLLLNENVTLTICHSYTDSFDLHYSYLPLADIVISAIGKAEEIIIPLNARENAIFIDAGISRVDGKQVGDISHDNKNHNLDKVYYTPWTGGVGKLTVAMLMYNVRKEV